MRFILKDGRLVQGDAVVDITDTIKQRVIDFSVDEREKLGITEVIEDPLPDERYGYVSEDIKNPGKWIFTPFAPEQLKPRLISYAGVVRYNKEIGGTVVNGVTVPTDRDNQKQFGLVQIFATLNPSDTYEWKFVDERGNVQFKTIDKTELTAFGVAIGKHVQACFVKESEVVDKINNGDITTYEAIDEYFA